MCSSLELTFKVFRFFLLVMMMVSKVLAQYQSPCPRTFRYETDPNGELHGLVGVYSFEDNVDLSVEMNVGNRVGSYNGHIALAIPKDQVVGKIRARQPITYKVFFPQWENTPPQITRIVVNGQDVCTGPPLELNGWFPVISRVTLNHRFTSAQPLNSLRPPNTNTFVRNPNNPFFENNGKDYDYGQRFPNQNPYFGNSFDDKPDFTNFLEITTTARTTRRTQNSFTTGSPFPKNPFIGTDSVTTTTTTRPTQKVPPRGSPSKSPPSSDVCGVPLVANPLILNGKSVPKGAFPWLTAMFASTGTGVEYKCCGSLVSHKHVVTAAHCVTQKDNKKVSPDKLLFVLGKLSIENLLLRDGEVMVGAEDIKVHPEYRPLTSDADIAVVILSREVTYTNYIRPICLWSESDDIDAVVNQKGKVVGWGRDEKNNSMTSEPRQVTIPVVSRETCLWSAEVFRYITSTRSFCAGERDNRGPCNGDSGSGFIMMRKGKWTLRGIVSISAYDSDKQTCDLSNYVAFTDVSKFRTWLLSIIVT